MSEAMQLYDPKLDFARTLIWHWSEIRHGQDLVPKERDLDWRELLPNAPVTTIMDVSQPGQSIIDFMGVKIRARYPPDLGRHDNWYAFLPPDAAKMAQSVVNLLVNTPRGVYYKYKLTDGAGAVETGEALALPMKRQDPKKATLWISLAKIEGEGSLIVSPVNLDSLFIEFVDIGAGILAEKLSS
jgi:hypothetical protein